MSCAIAASTRRVANAVGGSRICAMQAQSFGRRTSFFRTIASPTYSSRRDFPIRRCCHSLWRRLARSCRCMQSCVSRSRQSTRGCLSRNLGNDSEVARSHSLSFRYSHSNVAGSVERRSLMRIFGLCSIANSQPRRRHSRSERLHASFLLATRPGVSRNTR